MKPEDILIPAIFVASIWSIVLYRLLSGANEKTNKIPLQDWELISLMSEDMEVEPDNTNIKEPETVNARNKRGTPYTAAI